MCGRFSLKARPDDLWKALGTEPLPGYKPRYNVAPTQSVVAVVLEDGVRRPRLLHWGLVPFWADDPKIGNRLINARAETVATKPAFRSAFARRRCLVAADGFYEWQPGPSGKQPYRIRKRDESPFCFAGLWESWEKGGQAIESCTILTAAANAAIAPIHDRMPVILEPATYDVWLSPETGAEHLKQLLNDPAGVELEAYPVSTLVNRPANDIPGCIEPLVE
jgi:putative SOS response-associated peptidase YedK